MENKLMETEEKEISLKEAGRGEHDIIEEVHQKINSFTQEVFLDSLDEEMIAIIICNKAMNKLSELARARVINFLHRHYLDKVQTHQQLLKKLVSEMELGLAEARSSLTGDLNEKAEI